MTAVEQMAETARLRFDRRLCATPERCYCHTHAVSRWDRLAAENAVLDDLVDTASPEYQRAREAASSAIKAEMLARKERMLHIGALEILRRTS